MSELSTPPPMTILPTTTPTVTPAVGSTEVGSYFISNYPPFSQWQSEFVPDVLSAFAAEPNRDVPLGLYLHIPFCRKRCKFCYFRVYTDKNAREVETYLDALVREVELYAAAPVVGGRPRPTASAPGAGPSGR